MKLGFPNEIRMTVGEAQNWTCANGLNPIASYHHRLPNTVENKRRFPLLLNSPFNCVGLCQKCHDNYPHLFRITIQRAEVYETWLEKLKRGEI